ncbi:PE family protein [Mycobacterium sp. Z3061]|uniref:PE family protein n=1 Tax=Mycobacterium sp. Z3061 TaxID=3073562 RepID=UPI002877742F|nr:PE family protein [Mycobacterium sp. Z3061]
MSVLSIVPDAVATASSNLESVGSALRSASDAAVRRTTAIAPPAADEISSAITRLFGSHGQEFAAVNARASAFHAEFVKLLNGGALQYVNAEIANAQQTLSSLLGGASVVNPAEAISQTSSISTPFGPIAITQTFDTPASGNGPLSASISAVTPLGPVSFAINGAVSTVASPTSVVSTLGLTGGTVGFPTPLRLLVGAAGPVVTGGYSLFNSYNAFTSAMTGGNVLGAATAFFSAPFEWTKAVLVGHQTVTLPLGQLAASGPDISLGIPFGGLLASSAPLTMSIPQYSITDASAVPSITQTWTGSNFAFGGSQFGGLGTELLKAIGLPL